MSALKGMLLCFFHLAQLPSSSPPTMSESTPVSEVNVEVEADFTGADASRIVQSCQQPMHGADCKNPEGPDFPPGGSLYPVTNRKGKTEVLLCHPCFLYMQGKVGTITRKRPVTQSAPDVGSSTTSSGQVGTLHWFHSLHLLFLLLRQVDNFLKSLVYLVNHDSIRAGTNAAQRGGTPYHCIGY